MINKKTTGSKYEEMSSTSVDNSNSEEFLIDIGILMRKNEEYQFLLKEKNYGIEEKSEESKKISEADNVYTLKNYIGENFLKIKEDKQLQKDILKKLKRAESIVKKDSTELSLIITLKQSILHLLEDGEDEGE